MRQDSFGAMPSSASKSLTSFDAVLFIKFLNYNYRLANTQAFYGLFEASSIQMSDSIWKYRKYKNSSSIETSTC